MVIIVLAVVRLCSFIPIFYRVKNRSDSEALQNATPFAKWGNTQTKSQQIAYFCIKNN